MTDSMPTEGGPEKNELIQGVESTEAVAHNRELIEFFIMNDIQEEIEKSGLVMSYEADPYDWYDTKGLTYLSLKASYYKGASGLEDPQGRIKRHYEYVRAGHTVEGFTAHVSQIRCHTDLNDGSRTFKTLFIDPRSMIPDVKGPEIAPSIDRVLKIIRRFIGDVPHTVSEGKYDEYGLYALDVSVPKVGGGKIEYSYVRKGRKGELSSVNGPHLTPGITSCVYDSEDDFVPSGAHIHQYNF